MLTAYIRASMRKARYEALDDGFEDWLLLALREGDDLPTMDGISLNLPARDLAHVTDS